MKEKMDIIEQKIEMALQKMEVDIVEDIYYQAVSIYTDGGTALDIINLLEQTWKAKLEEIIYTLVGHKIPIDIVTNFPIESEQITIMEVIKK